MSNGKEITQFEPFILMERIEDEAILAEIKGEVIRDFVYSFKDSSGRTVEGLSKAGVDAVVSDLARRGEAIRELDLNWTEDEKCFKATVKAGRYAISKDGSEVLLDSSFGAKRQSKTFTTKAGDEIENPFAFELCITKACRNAKRMLIPESLAIELIERAKKEGKARNIPPTYGKPAPAKAEPEEEKLKKLRQQIGIEAGKVWKSDEERKEWQKSEYGIESLTEVTEVDKLQEILTKVKAMQPHEPTAEELGFSNQAEQGQMRKELFKLLGELGLDTNEKKREYLAGKDIHTHTAKLPKDELKKIIEEVEKQKASVEEAEAIPEEL